LTLRREHSSTVARPQCPLHRFAVPLPRRLRDREERAVIEQDKRRSKLAAVDLRRAAFAAWGARPNRDARNPEALLLTTRGCFALFASRSVK
jgi:hypothetical protein